MREIKIFTALMLIVLCAYSQSGTPKLIVQGRDTLALVPTNYITNANRVKNMNDAQKELLDTVFKALHSSEKTVLLQKKEISILDTLISIKNKDIDKCSTSLKETQESLEKAIKRYTLLKWLLVGETIAICFLLAK